MGLSNIRSEALEKSERKFEKKLQFYSKVRENVASLRATKTIGKKNKNARKRQKNLKAYDLSTLAEILPEATAQRKGPAPLPKPGKKCKSRQTLVLQEANRLKTVFSNPVFQADPLAAIHQHLQTTQPAPERQPRKKSNDDTKKKRKKKSKTSSTPRSMEM
ncbi:hypothetical protein RND81_09G163300 [Saponaria officinalis]|uniref:Ribosome biogenesis protein slx9-like n=1 Tax=Saponaria officinalis TaxID=3572 RepID=A0AAW1INI3_SAPOF